LPLHCTLWCHSLLPTLAFPFSLAWPAWHAILPFLDCLPRQDEPRYCRSQKTTNLPRTATLHTHTHTKRHTHHPTAPAYFYPSPPGRAGRTFAYPELPYSSSLRSFPAFVVVLAFLTFHTGLNSGGLACTGTFGWQH